MSAQMQQDCAVEGSEGREGGVNLSSPIVLIGMPASGKSRIGRELARRLGCDHSDSDALIEAEHGRSVADIFADEGEAAFRAYEVRAIEGALNVPGVLSLGGGAAMQPAVRELLAGHTVVYLEAPLEELIRRASRSSGRPLLAGDVKGRMRQLYAERTHVYREVASVCIPTGNGPSSIVVADVCRALGYPVEHPPTVIDVRGDSPYQVHIGSHLPGDTIVGALRQQTTKVLVLFAPPLASYAREVQENLTRAGYEVVSEGLPDGESAKTLEECARLWDVAGAHRLGRADAIIAIGGGATTDLGGFVAASWLRGIDVIQVPTTLLGMVDAAVGGKTGINTDAGKNLVGAFHPPVRVVEDLSLLGSLPPEDLRAGLGEVIKCGFIADSHILELVEAVPRAVADPVSPLVEELVCRSVRVKADVVSEDLMESGLREILNYGHTLAHAIERCENYTRRHGEAVAIGCVFAAELAHSLGMLSADDVRTHRDLLSSVGLPTSYEGASLRELLDVMMTDKKVRSGRLRFVLLEGMQRPVTRECSPEDLIVPARRVGIRVDDE